jgi:hypothetical protein
MERPGALLARRTRTVNLCSFDARSEGQSGDSFAAEIDHLGCVDKRRQLQ